MHRQQQDKIKRKKGGPTALDNFDGRLTRLPSLARFVEKDKKLRNGSFFCLLIAKLCYTFEQLKKQNFLSFIYVNIWLRVRQSLLTGR